MLAGLVVGSHGVAVAAEAVLADEEDGGGDACQEDSPDDGDDDVKVVAEVALGGAHRGGEQRGALPRGHGALLAEEADGARLGDHRGDDGAVEAPGARQARRLVRGAVGRVVGARVAYRAQHRAIGV